MLSTFSTLQESVRELNVSLPHRAVDDPARTGVLEGFRRRNAALDAFFYDVGVVSDDEARALAPWSAREGSVLVVPPTGMGSIRVCSDIETLIAAGGATDGALCVAGVGSSALGAAAFARNVANATGGTTVAVVSGYGLADLGSEALGGWFWFGTINRMRHAFESLDASAERRTGVAVASPSGPRQAVGRGVSVDTLMVLSLLMDACFAFRLLTGHSKGNLVLSEALYALVRSGPRSVWSVQPDCLVVTVSATIAMPPTFTRIIDVMGEWDWFGRLNSRGDIPVDVEVPRAWHHTNTELPHHLPVERTFDVILRNYP